MQNTVAREDRSLGPVRREFGSALLTASHRSCTVSCYRGKVLALHVEIGEQTAQPVDSSIIQPNFRPAHGLQHLPLHVGSSGEGAVAVLRTPTARTGLAVPLSQARKASDLRMETASDPRTVVRSTRGSTDAFAPLAWSAPVASPSTSPRPTSPGA